MNIEHYDFYNTANDTTEYDITKVGDDLYVITNRFTLEDKVKLVPFNKDMYDDMLEQVIEVEAYDDVTSYIDIRRDVVGKLYAYEYDI